MTASLYQAHAPWLTSPYLDVDFVGLEQDGRSVAGRLRLPVDQAGGLTRLQAELVRGAETEYVTCPGQGGGDA
ncbi:MAG TPA: hypothetical protein VJT31_01540 [Rugosimonospora sp.]|nr:hypothetical protein [Rugosimonospora sp.]